MSCTNAAISSNEFRQIIWPWRQDSHSSMDVAIYWTLGSGGGLPNEEASRSGSSKESRWCPRQSLCVDIFHTACRNGRVCRKPSRRAAVAGRRLRGRVDVPATKRGPIGICACGWAGASNASPANFRTGNHSRDGDAIRRIQERTTREDRQCTGCRGGHCRSRIGRDHRWPMARADDLTTTTIGNEARLTEGTVVHGWTISNLKASRPDSLPGGGHPVGGDSHGPGHHG